MSPSLININEMLMNIHQSHDFPDVDISKDAHCPTIIRDSEAKAAFLQHQETPRKRLIAAWSICKLLGDNFFALFVFQV